MQRQFFEILVLATFAIELFVVIPVLFNLIRRAKKTRPYIIQYREHGDENCNEIIIFERSHKCAAKTFFSMFKGRHFNSFSIEELR